MAVQADTSTPRAGARAFLASAIERAFSHAAAKLSTHAGWPALLLDSHALIGADFVCVDLGQFRLAKKPGQRANVQLVFVKCLRGDVGPSAWRATLPQLRGKAFA
jgi:hypothetical protein